MIEIVGGSLLVVACLSFLLKKPVSKLWDLRACPAHPIEYEKKLKVDPAKQELKVLILGDFGSGTNEQHAVARASEKTCSELGCDLVLLAGDNFIQKGISCIKDEQLETKFESVYNLQVPFFAVLGNHDLAGNWRAQIEYSAVSERWNMPDTNYDLELGPLRIYAINTTCSIRTLWRLFRKTKKPWRLVLGHHPAISSGRHGYMTWLERFVIGLSGVHFFVSGHNHALEHAVTHNFDQIVSGGGGSPLNKSEKPPLNCSRFFSEEHGYTWAHFTSDQASFHYFDINGKEKYTFTRRK